MKKSSFVSKNLFDVPTNHSGTRDDNKWFFPSKSHGWNYALVSYNDIGEKKGWGLIWFYCPFSLSLSVKQIQITEREKESEKDRKIERQRERKKKNVF